MQRLSQLSSQLKQQLGRTESHPGTSSNTPLQADCGIPPTATINTSMAKSKVVVTRQLINEAQRLLDAKKGDLEIVQWQSEKVCTDWR